MCVLSLPLEARYFLCTDKELLPFSHRWCDLLSCRNKKVSKKMLPLHSPIVRGLLAYSVKLCDSPSMAHHKGSASVPRPAGFHLRWAKRHLRQRKGICHWASAVLPPVNLLLVYVRAIRPHVWVCEFLCFLKNTNRASHGRRARFCWAGMRIKTGQGKKD